MRSAGYSTKLYNMILDFLSRSSERAVTAGDVYDYVRSKSETVNKTTVYRNLDRLVSEGKLLKYVTDDGKMASYVFHEPEHNCMGHLHLRCSCCGKVIHLDCGLTDELVEHISCEHGFDIRCGDSILYGTCRECREREKNL